MVGEEIDGVANGVDGGLEGGGGGFLVELRLWKERRKRYFGVEIIVEDFCAQYTLIYIKHILCGTVNTQHIHDSQTLLSLSISLTSSL